MHVVVFFHGIYFESLPYIFIIIYFILGYESVDARAVCGDNCQQMCSRWQALVKWSSQQSFKNKVCASKVKVFLICASYLQCTGNMWVCRKYEVEFRDTLSFSSSIWPVFIVQCNHKWTLILPSKLCAWYWHLTIYFELWYIFS